MNENIILTEKYGVKESYFNKDGNSIPLRTIIDELIDPVNRNVYKDKEDFTHQIVIDRHMMMKKICDYLNIKLNHYSSTLRLSCDVERQHVIRDMICDLDELLLQNMECDDKWVKESLESVTEKV